MSECWPDLLIVDLQIPHINGFAMLKILSQTPEMARATIAVVTGMDAEVIKERGGVPPRVEVLPKPIPFDRLLAIATGIVQQSSSQIAAS